MTSKTKTVYYPDVFDQKTSEAIYEYLLKNIEWEDSTYSYKQKQISRKGYSFDSVYSKENEELVKQLVEITLQKTKNTEYAVLGTYLNYYRDGNDFRSLHTHKETVQMIISFGIERSLHVGKKEYPLASGSAIIFGSSAHKIDKDPNITTGRISIAIFMKKLSDLIQDLEILEIENSK